MFRDSMKGLEKIFHTEPPQGSVVMVVGRPGTMKSSITHQILTSFLWNNKNERATYITLEETEESHRRNMSSLGISSPDKQYFIEDLASFRQDITPRQSFLQEEEYLDLIMKEISKPFALYGQAGREDAMRFMGFDSLNALQNLFLMERRKIRFRMQDFFMRLRQRKVTSLIIMEGDPDEMMDEYFMADGVIEVGIDRVVPHMPKRYIMVRKMRGTVHEMAPYMLNVTKNGLEVGEPLIGWKNR